MSRRSGSFAPSLLGESFPPISARPAQHENAGYCKACPTRAIGQKKEVENIFFKAVDSFPDVARIAGLSNALGFA